MSFRIPVSLVALLALAAAGCATRTTPVPGGEAGVGDGKVASDSGTPGKDSKLVRDKKVPPRDRGPGADLPWPKLDTRPQDGPVKPPLDRGPTCGPMGNGCTRDADCCGKLICAKAFTGARFCSQKCTPDNPKTPLTNEDDCPGAPNKFICANITSPPTDTYRCAKRCSPTTGKNTCPTGLACEPLSTIMTQTTDRAVCAWPACTSGQNCPVYMTKLCAPASPLTQCAGQPAGTFCAPYYLGSFGGRCALPGVCDKVSGLCMPHTRGKATAKVGDPCQDDRNCGGQMICRQYVAAGGVHYYRNGYCSIIGCSFGATFTQRACPSGSTCSRRYYGGRCLKTCDLNNASTCRGYSKDMYGDYDCRAWNLYVGKVTAKPVCEAGHVLLCSYFTGTKLGCEDVGLKSNPTKMVCRSPTSGKQLSAHHPNGYCLDLTASGK